MFKKYQVGIEVNKIVHRNTAHGLSRYTHREVAKRFVVSIGSERSHKSSLRVFGRWLLETQHKMLRNASTADATDFLNWRAQTVGQSAVSLARQAVNLHLFSEAPLGFVASEIKKPKENRAYSAAEIELLKAAADPELLLSIELAAYSGLRAVELITICRASDAPQSAREWSEKRFLGRPAAVLYVVRGKGGLLREVALSSHLAQRLEQRRRLGTTLVCDRQADWESWFDILGGQPFSNSFSALSKHVLGYSMGAHGLRHGFAQARRDDLLCIGLTIQETIEVLSQELGHFDTKNTFSYLRD